ncbi:uncharacterized protein EV420DRAFT_764327 [Desarmillaria tabescens]|uniref:HNH nuclease domain-containing protein n=1 Tax=Armillaria tabescens TaxID=1929756 RepID=A0AA39JXR6_ARMTA|nr:uncharacterized protein EV420DRAFT_764327 [Desarmillaria tabescens]KAK0449775.1 hypothetical protein EV420DRAFT_764327 [Desarmillaria tabescens]
MPNYDPLQFVFPRGPAPLPTSTPENFTTKQHTAYAGAQAIESLSQWSVVSAGSMKPQVAGRLLGYMLLEAPTVEGRDNVTFEIASCGGDEARLKQLAQLYAAVYIRTFKVNDGKTPNHIDEPLPDSYGGEKEDVPLRTRWETRRNASKRDRHQCVLSRSYDLQYMCDLFRMEPGHPLFSSSVTCDPVEEARIISIERKANIADSQHQVKLKNPTRAAAILSRFGKTDIFKELDIDDLNHMSNIMTLNSSIHRFFDALHMCLVAVEGQPNTYRIEAFLPSVLNTIPENPVTFTTSDEENLPLPSPALLALHRACTRVAHFSGAGSYIDDLLEMDDPVVECDGSNWERPGEALDLKLLGVATRRTYCPPIRYAEVSMTELPRDLVLVNQFVVWLPFREVTSR